MHAFLVFLLVLNTPSGWAQSPPSIDSNPAEFNGLEVNDDFEETQACLSGDPYSWGTDADTLQSIATALHEASDLGISRETLKEMYRKNGCNPDGLDQILPPPQEEEGILFKKPELHQLTPSSHPPTTLTPITPFRFAHSLNDEQLSACRMNQLLNDVEGCRELRDLAKRIKQQQFRPADLNQLTQRDLEQMSKGNRLGAAGLIVTTLNFLLDAYRTFWKDTPDPQEKKDDPKPATSTTKTKPNQNEPSESSGSHSDDHGSSNTPQDSAPPETHDSQPPPLEPIKNPATQDLGQTDLKLKEDNDRPIVREDPDFQMKAWEELNRLLKTELDRCDGKLRDKRLGTPGLSEHGTYTSYNPESTQTFACQQNILYRDLTELKAKQTQCIQARAPCDIKTDNKLDPATEKRRLLAEYEHSYCAQEARNFGPEIKPDPLSKKSQRCRELEKKLFGDRSKVFNLKPLMEMPSLNPNLPKPKVLP